MMSISQSQRIPEIEPVKEVAVKTETNINEIEKIETELKKLKTTREIVEEEFGDIPIMIEIARCESGFRQHKNDGAVLRGYVNPADVGVMQINEKYHASTAVRLGYNIYSTEGNMAYARYLYETQGTRPWVHSSRCWNNVREVVLAN